MKRAINLLLVEDNADDVFFIKEMLSESVSIEYRVHWVDLVSRGRHWLEKHPTDVDLVLLDLNLPDCRGIDTFQSFKEYTSYIPIILLTGLDDEEIGEQAIKQGAQDYICKNDLGQGILENSIRFSIERHHVILQLEKKKDQYMRNEHRFRHIIEKNVDGILILDKRGKVIFSNPAVERIFARKPEEMPESVFQSALSPGKTIEMTFIKGKEGLRYVELESREIEWDGKISYMAGIRDITERKQLERSLLIEKERLDITLKSIGDGVITTDREGNIRLINRAFEQMTGWTQDQVEGQSIYELLNIGNRLNSTSESEREVYNGNTTLLLKGEEITLSFSGAPILDKINQVIGYGFIIRDTTLQQELIDEMITIQKLKSLGIVAGKLAHNYNTSFYFILQNICRAKKQVNNNPQVLNMLEKAEKSAHRAQALTDQLDTFSKGKPSMQRSVSISQLLEEVVQEILEDFNLTGPPIICHWQKKHNLWKVEFDKVQIRRAFWNIIKNTVEALPNGGEMEITMENRSVSEEMLLPVNNGDYLKISIKDYGIGIEKEIQQKIFDPFFTTKEKATGMGLPTAFSIIREHRGTIKVESEKGKGSQFIIYLPAVKKSSKI